MNKALLHRAYRNIIAFFKKQYAFNGTDQYIDTGIVFPFGSSDTFTQYFDVEFLRDGTQEALSGAIDAFWKNQIIFLRFANGDLGVNIRSTGIAKEYTIRTDDSVPSGEVVKIGYVFKGMNLGAYDIEIFVNGVFVPTTVTLDDSDGLDFQATTSNYYLGALNNNGSSAASFANIKLRNYALISDNLSALEIANLDYTFSGDLTEFLDPALIYQEFLFDNDTGVLQTLDNSGNGRHGTPVNMLAANLQPEEEVVYTEPFSFGNVFKTFGNTDYAAPVSSLTVLNGASKASTHCWIYKASGKRAIIGANLASGNRFAFSFFSDNTIYCLLANGADSYGSINGASFLSGWHCFSMVFDGTQTGNANRLKLYIDEVQQTLTFVGTIPATLPATIADNFRLNYSVVGNTFGEAEYAIPVATNDASTPGQISAFYNSGNGALPEDCFTNIVANPDTNQADGATVMPGRLSTPNFDLTNVSTPPAYFVPKT